ncbi:hypothetical protein PR003_g16110 [Phytophthora rubi]|uniref:SET domain-containing protein n=1 Tax=Phytophthora rubi TaxID=129364 RepID=A0A6A4ETG7_9STRA|nr:hypothetical protein PR003_g16110 [Phytophthora rubi]
MRASVLRRTTCIAPRPLTKTVMFVAPTPPKVAITPLPPTKDSAFVTPLPSTKSIKLVAPSWSLRPVQHRWCPTQATCSCRRGGLTPSRTYMSSLIHSQPSSPRVSCCPYEGKCGNGFEESPKVFLGLNIRTRQLGVVAAEDIGAGEVLGQYLKEIEHRPEKPAYPACAAINAEGRGGLMRFLNHSCKPAAEFKEVSNHRRMTVVVATTQKIKHDDEVTMAYGDDLWFVCRCMQDGCRHRSIQDEQDP